ncbi:MAG: hypothetical protein K2N14_02260 [Clostridia bacterium]|nr:hypothetical protein [Clostridia bacterium]
MDKNDWRLDGYNGYLNCAIFKLEKFKSTATNDHEHCVFCWQKITDLDIADCDREGYCTTDIETEQTNWVCKQCYNDFKEQFNFKLK